jgi:predicted homoserine dehydrogenase-like protein
MKDSPVIRIGVVGTGFISSHFIMALDRQEGFTASRVLTRRPVDGCTGFPRPELLTNSLANLIENSDVVLECTGDAIHATDVVAAALSANLPVVTMNSEFHITAGSYFVGKGLVTEAEGDQPGCQAALKEEVLDMGFEPLVYGNIKGFLNQDPTLEDMTYWGNRSGISLPMVTSFTDGTKVQIEQAFVANGLGAEVAKPGLLGVPEDDLRTGGSALAEAAEKLGKPIADYVLSLKLPHGVFVVGKHDPRQKGALRYLKLGDGPYYVVLKHNIFVHLEILRTIKRVVNQGRILLDNSAHPVASVCTVVKRDLKPGDRIASGIGSFDVRGEAVRIADTAGHVPIGLLADAVIKRPLKRGDIIGMDDVELPESLALRAWVEIERSVLNGRPIGMETGAEKKSALAS